MNSDISKGKLLVAMPTLLDPHFRQTVVLLCEYGAEGALGLVINRPTEVEVSTLISDLPDLIRTERLFSGGPVGKTGMLVLCRGDAGLSGHFILQDLFLAQDIEIFKRLGAQGSTGEVRCYLGYAGWGPGQLEGEIQSGAWRVASIDAASLFKKNPSSFWPDMMRSIGGEWALYSSMPIDPNLN